MNTNIIIKQLTQIKRSVIALFLLLTLSLNFSCVDSAEEFQVVSDTPFGVGIIAFSSIPALIFGNGCEIDTIKVNTGLIADGSTIDVEITNTGTLESAAGGCVLGASGTVVNGMATLDFLSPILIGNEGETANVNVAVRITIPGNGETPDTVVNDFFTALVNAVGITPPADFEATPNSLDDPTSVFFNLEFTTFGLKPGTEVECMVSNESIGSVTSNTAVIGTVQSGSFNVEYTLENGSLGGAQVLTCMVELPNPSSFDPSCGSVPLVDRKINATVVITHGDAAQPEPDSVTCTPNPITGGQDGICTCNSTNAAGQTINFGAPGPTISFPGGSSAIADVDGNASVTFDTEVVDEQVIEQVTCTPDGSPFFTQTNVTINPGTVNSLTCVPNPVASDVAGGVDVDVLCTCGTNSPFTEVCFEEVIPAGELDFSPDPFCVDADANGNALLMATVDDGVLVDTDVILECCLDGDDPADDCDNNLTQETTLNITPFVPPNQTISCTAQSSTVGPGESTFVDINITGFVFGQEVCLDIPINTSPASSVGACTATDANGDASILFTGGAVAALDTATVRCFADTIDAGGSDDTFDPGELSDTTDIDVDPGSGPAPIEVACSVQPASVPTSIDALVTLTLTNAPTGTATCIEFFNNTSPASTLADDDEAANTTRVCSTTNLANQAFATFEPNPAIVGSAQNADFLCCADVGADGMTSDMDCTAVDPQITAAVQVDPGQPLPFTVSIVSSGDVMPAAGISRTVEFSTNPPVPDGTELCLVKIDDLTTGGAAEVESPTEGPVTTTDPLPSSVANSVCDPVTNGLGTFPSGFIFTNDGAAVSTETATVVGCIDFDANGGCELDEPISNTITFITP